MTAEATDPAETADSQEASTSAGKPSSPDLESFPTAENDPPITPLAPDEDDAPLSAVSSEEIYGGMQPEALPELPPELLPELPPEPPPEPAFDILTSEPLSFAALEEGRVRVFRSLRQRNRFREVIADLSSEGEEGRRRGLGWWILARYERCEEALAPHDGDDTAAFTRAKALAALGRHAEATAIFERLTNAYPLEPRPRAAWLEARLDAELARDDVDTEQLSETIAGEIAAAPAEFADTADGHYITGRLAELRRDWESALDHYGHGCDLEPANHGLLSRFARLAEQCGLDELALEAYESLLQQHGPMDRSMMLNLGVLYEDAGRDIEAAALYDTVLKNNGTDEVARLYLADAHAATDMYYDEDLEKKEDRLNQILRIPITDFELSVRARNCLNKMQICTLGDLVQRTEQELLSYKNFGETSLTEIKEILHSKGLRLGMPREEAVASIEAHATRVSTGEKGDVMNKPILELQLSIRARRTVETLGCLTVGDIIKHSAEELLGMPNFGQTSLMELRNKLGELGLKLKGE